MTKKSMCMLALLLRGWFVIVGHIAWLLGPLLLRCLPSLIHASFATPGFYCTVRDRSVSIQLKQTTLPGLQGFWLYKVENSSGQLKYHCRHKVGLCFIYWGPPWPWSPQTLCFVGSWLFFPRMLAMAIFWGGTPHSHGKFITWMNRVRFRRGFPTLLLRCMRVPTP